MSRAPAATLMRRSIAAALLVLLLGLGSALGNPLRFDVLVYGSEPEAVVAAVAAAEEGASVVLVAEAGRLGGLFVQGELNVLDLKTQPHDFQLGLFERWWALVGREEAFDVPLAEAAFHRLLADAGVSTYLGARDVVPHIVAPGLVTGASFMSAAGASVTVEARQLIDASGDADLAANAGVGFDLGWRAFGVDQRMADTLVLNVEGVDWTALTEGVRERGRSYAIAKEWVVWGHFGGVPAAYQPTQPGMRLRGLNLGRQHDGTVFINALLLYGLDPLDPASLADGRARALVEGEHIVAYLAEHVPGFADASLAGAAETLYVRESEVTTELDVHLLVDASASMAWQAAGRESKLRLAQRTGALLAWIALARADRTEPHRSGSDDRRRWRHLRRVDRGKERHSVSLARPIRRGNSDIFI